MRTISLAILATAILANHGWAEESGLAAPRYATPEKSPGFRNPQFISRPLLKAYPGIEYNIRPAIKGGTFPYAFTLEASPRGMNIDAAKGTVTWTAPKTGGTHKVAITVRDAGP